MLGHSLFIALPPVRALSDLPPSLLSPHFPPSREVGTPWWEPDLTCSRQALRFDDMLYPFTRIVFCGFNVDSSLGQPGG